MTRCCLVCEVEGDRRAAQEAAFLLSLTAPDAPREELTSQTERERATKEDG